MKKLAVVAVFALLAGGAAAQQPLPPGGKEFKDGDTAFKKKDWATAITNFEAAVKANGTLYASHYFLGYAYKNTSDFGKSGDNFALFLEKVPNDPKAADMVVAATREAGISYARARDYEKAIPFLEKAATGKPNDTEVLFFLGVAQMTTKDEAAAEQTFAKVIQLQPQFDRPYYFAGRINFNRESWALAKERLGKYLELSPSGDFAAESNYMLGLMAARVQQKGLASTHLNKGLQLKPRSSQAAEAHYILGRYAAEAENFDSAVSHFQRFLQLQPTGPQAEEIRKFLEDLK